MHVFGQKTVCPVFCFTIRKPTSKASSSSLSSCPLPPTHHSSLLSCSPEWSQENHPLAHCLQLFNLNWFCHSQPWNSYNDIPSFTRRQYLVVKVTDYLVKPTCMWIPAVWASVSVSTQWGWQHSPSHRRWQQSAGLVPSPCLTYNKHLVNST